MSDSSRDNDSGGSRKSLKDRLQSKQGFESDGLKKGLNHLSGSFKNMGSTIQGLFAPKTDQSVYSKGVRELDSYGYEKYNIDDGDEIFISKVPDKALFNDGEPIIMRATGGNFVGSSDNTSARINVEEAQSQTRDPRSLFTNVPRGTIDDGEIKATIGTVDSDGNIEPAVNNSFLERMSRKQVENNVRPVPRVELEEDDPDAPVFIEIGDAEEDVVEVPETIRSVPTPDAPAQEDIVQASAEEQAVEAPAQVNNAFLNRMTRPTKEFIIDPEDDVEVPESVETPETPESDEDWAYDIPEDMLVSTEEPITAFTEGPVIDEVVEAAAEIPEEPVDRFEESPAEAPVTAFTEVPMTEDAQEAVTEIPEEPVAVIPVIDYDAEQAVDDDLLDSAVEELVAQDIIEEIAIEQAVADAIAEIGEQPAQDAPVAVMTLPEIPVEQPAAEEPAEGIQGLYVEGSEPSSEAAVADEAPVATPVVAEAVVTGAEAAPAPVAKIGLEEDGEALPRLSNPVITRPRSARSVRFKFSNGVLENVNQEKVEPREELRDPLA